MQHQIYIMKHAKLELNDAWNTYTCTEVSDAEMFILGNMLADDVRDNALSYKQTLADDTLRGQSGNFVCMVKENGFVILSDLYSEKTASTEFRIPLHIFEGLLDDWQEKVCKHKPREVAIKYAGDKFSIETEQ
jgi:hypothetical protein